MLGLHLLASSEPSHGGLLRSLPILSLSSHIRCHYIWLLIKHHRARLRNRSRSKYINNCMIAQNAEIVALLITGRNYQDYLKKQIGQNSSLGNVVRLSMIIYEIIYKFFCHPQKGYETLTSFQITNSKLYIIIIILIKKNTLIFSI